MCLQQLWKQSMQSIAKYDLNHTQINDSYNFLFSAQKREEETLYAQQKENSTSSH